MVAFDLLNGWLGTKDMTWTQWGLALAPAGALLVLWELGKLIARRAKGGASAAADPPGVAQPDQQSPAV